MDPSLDQILDFLENHQIRATYGAVGGVIGVPAQSMGKALGRRCPRASWIVRTDTGRATGYPKQDQTSDIIRTSDELIRRMRIGT